MVSLCRWRSLYGGRWRTIEVLPTNNRGRWAYKYVFTLGAGASYLFRAVTVPNGSYPFLAATSPTRACAHPLGLVRLSAAAMIAPADTPRSLPRWRRLRIRLLLEIFALPLAPAVLHPSPAQAGEWVQRSCSYDGEYISPEGWEAKAYYGYSELPHAYCEKVAEGSEGGLTVYATPYDGDQDFAGQGWIYKPPAGSVIAGGKVEARLRS